MAVGTGTSCAGYHARTLAVCMAVDHCPFYGPALFILDGKTAESVVVLLMVIFEARSLEVTKCKTDQWCLISLGRTGLCLSVGFYPDPVFSQT